MAKPYDAVLKVLVETEPEGWLPLVGRPRAPASVLDTDISTLLADPHHAYSGAWM